MVSERCKTTMMGRFNKECNADVASILESDQDEGGGGRKRNCRRGVRREKQAPPPLRLGTLRFVSSLTGGSFITLLPVRRPGFSLVGSFCSLGANYQARMPLPAAAEEAQKVPLRCWVYLWNQSRRGRGAHITLKAYFGGSGLNEARQQHR